jgi:hypothetical protein
MTVAGALLFVLMCEVLDDAFEVASRILASHHRHLPMAAANFLPHVNCCLSTKKAIFKLGQLNLQLDFALLCLRKPLR